MLCPGDNDHQKNRESDVFFQCGYNIKNLTGILTVSDSKAKKNSALDAFLIINISLFAIWYFCLFSRSPSTATDI